MWRTRCKSPGENARRGAGNSPLTFRIIFLVRSNFLSAHEFSNLRSSPWQSNISSSGRRDRQVSRMKFHRALLDEGNSYNKRNSKDKYSKLFIEVAPPLSVDWNTACTGFGVPPVRAQHHMPNFATSATKLVCRASRKRCSTWPVLEPRPTSNSELGAQFWSYSKPRRFS
jgi:hypothetical protein